MRCRLAVLMVFCAVPWLTAQVPASRPPQTARQAVIEIFQGGDSDAMAKHLPESARKLLPHDATESIAFNIVRTSPVARMLSLRSDTTTTFDSGPLLFVTDENDSQNRIEIRVEHDRLADDVDEIELSLHTYQNGEEQFSVVEPTLRLTLQRERNAWRLADVIAMNRIPLHDQKYLEWFSKQQRENNESSAQARIKFIVKAETGYAGEHPDQGYRCSLAELFQPAPASELLPPPPQPPNSEVIADDSSDAPAPYFDPGQGNSDWSGYRFALSGCAGSPASHYQITAVPIESRSGTNVYCSDESGVVRSLAGGSIAECFAQGDVVSSPEDDEDSSGPNVAQAPVME